MQLSDYTNTVRTRYSDQFLAYKHDLFIGASLLEYGEYQQVEIDLLLSLINENTVIYDIGGNVGYHATAFASKSKHVYTFEASPQHYDLLRRNLDGNIHCRHYNLAIGDHNGTINVETVDVTQAGNYGEACVGSDSGQTVPVRSIDTLIEKNKLMPPHVMKIDVEGHEPNVLRGALKTIRQHQPLIYLEAQDSNNTPEIYQLLTDLKYSLGWCIIRNYNPNNFNQNTNNHFENSAIFSIIAFPEKNPTVWPEPVIGPDDTWEKLLARQEK